ncbi:MAG: hypothetical protein ABIJ56_07020 [Pseudomonadota bacterium]
MEVATGSARIVRSAAAALLLLAAAWLPAHEAKAAPEPMSRDEIIALAASGVGYSYWWGSECWREDGTCPGSCSGSCPSCTHSACCSGGCSEYGADCSGFATKVWQVPDPIALSACHVFRYTTVEFRNNTTHWDQIARGDMEKGDAAVYNSGSGGHIVIYESGDPWGSIWAYEARGCSTGIVHNERSLSSSYIGIRRHNLIVGDCSPGETGSQACGDCGTQTRSCGGDYTWGGWSACDGPDPDGGEQVCDTGGQGVCGEGRMRCEEGWLNCRGLFTPVDELCDDLDNDCDGEADEESPALLGELEPVYAASFFNRSFPAGLAAGGEADVWLEFLNEGSAAWAAGDITLRALGPEDSDVSELYVPGDWPSADTAAVLEAAVADGGIARFEFRIRAPDMPGERLVELFTLAGPSGELIKCPAPGYQAELDILEEGADPLLDMADIADRPADAAVDAPADETAAPDDGLPHVTPQGLESGCGCIIVVGR